MNSYKEKLIEDWLTKAGERGGIDVAFGQYLVSKGHEILWLGHSPFENGKDISTIAPDGTFHAYQIKDEDLSIDEFRKIKPQVDELIELPIAHPRVPPGSKHKPHLVTSGIIKETVAQKVSALNSKLRKKREPQLEVIDRFGLITRFATMSSGFWPDRPEDVRKLLSFYLSDGIGGLDPKSFAEFIDGRIQAGPAKASNNSRLQRVASASIFTSIALSPFEESQDHWTLFQAWMITSACIARHSEQLKLPEREWKKTFGLTIDRAKYHLVSIAKEGASEGALRPRDLEIEDYTGARNLKVCSCLAAVCMLGAADQIGGQQSIDDLIEKAASNGALSFFCEGQTAQLAFLVWGTKSISARKAAIDLLKVVLLRIIERNHKGSPQPTLPDPYVSEDDALLELLHRDKVATNNAQTSWTLEPLVRMLVARNEKDFLRAVWPGVSRTSLTHFEPQEPLDILNWNCNSGTEVDDKFQDRESFARLAQTSVDPKYKAPACLLSDLEFSIMFTLAFPHRFHWGSIRHIDAQFING